MYANQELCWLPMDTKELYFDNLKNKYHRLEQFGWIDASITYKFNSYGFRSEEFSHNPNIVFLGCSHTCGIGLPVEHTWASIVSNTLGFKNFNLGIGGTSNDTAFRVAQHWIPQLTPAIVMFLSTERTRFELHTESTLQNWGHWSGSESGCADIWRRWISSDINSNMNYLKNILAIQQICNQHNIKFLHIEYNNLNNLNKKTNDFARDLGHGGTLTNQHIANLFLSKLDGAG